MKASTKIMFGCFGLFAVALYAAGSKPVDRCKDEFWACMPSTRFVTDRLLSPASADFPRSQAPGVIITAAHAQVQKETNRNFADHGVAP